MPSSWEISRTDALDTYLFAKEQVQAITDRWQVDYNKIPPTRIARGGIPPVQFIPRLIHSSDYLSTHAYSLGLKPLLGRSCRFLTLLSYTI